MSNTCHANPRNNARLSTAPPRNTSGAGRPRGDVGTRQIVRRRDRFIKRLTAVTNCRQPRRRLELPHRKAQAACNAPGTAEVATSVVGRQAMRRWLCCACVPGEEVTSQSARRAIPGACDARRAAAEKPQRRIIRRLRSAAIESPKQTGPKPPRSADAMDVMTDHGAAMQRRALLRQDR
jgi:hypothetical protein